MSELVVIAYPDEHRAAEVFAALQRSHRDQLRDADTPRALYVTKGRGGEVQVHRSQHLSHVGAAGVGTAGLLLGLVCALPIAGAAVGAGAGMLMGRGADLGISDEFIADLSANLVPGSSAIFLLLRPVSAADVLGTVGKFGGTVLRTTLPPDVEERLERSLAFWEGQHPARAAAPDRPAPTEEPAAMPIDSGR